MDNFTVVTKKQRKQKIDIEKYFTADRLNYLLPCHRKLKNFEYVSDRDILRDLKLYGQGQLMKITEITSFLILNNFMNHIH